MKKKRRRVFRERGIALLEALDRGVDLLTASPGELSLALQVGGLDTARLLRAERDYWANQKAMKRLRAQKLIRVRNLGDQVIHELTTDGKLLLLKSRILKTERLYSNGEQCIVSFDIPEAARRTRMMFRLFLKEAGFSRLHDSLWVASKQVTSDLQELICCIGISKWVSVFLAYEVS